MDIEEHADLIFGDEFCFPATTTYYPTLHTPAGINVPAEFYGHQAIPGFSNRGQNYMGHQDQGTSRMCYVVPDYAHPPHGPFPLLPCAIANGRTAGTQNHHAENVEHPYYQHVHSSHYAVLPSAADMAPASTAQPPADTSGLFCPCGPGQTVAVASERGVSRSPSLQSASVSSMKFQNRTVVPEGRLRGTAPWKRQLADRPRPRVPAKLPRARQASRQSRQAPVPSVQSSLQTNFSYKDHVPNVGSHFCKMSAENSQPCSKTSSYANRRLGFLSKYNICKPKKQIGPMPSEIIVKSYTSRLHIGNPEGKIILKTDQYNRNEFKVVYPNAKFFVMKSFDEADVHKSIKYGVWSTSSIGNKKLDNAFREAQAIAASGSTPCPVFLFFSVNGSSRFCGVAEMVGPVDWQKDMDFWCKDKWIGSFPVKWHIIKDVYNSSFRDILLENNEDMPVTSSRDTQEIYYTPGTTMLKIFKYAKANDCLLDEFMMHEDEESKRSQGRRFELRRAAPQFLPLSMHHAHQTYSTLLPKSPLLVPASMHAHHIRNALLPRFPQLMPASMHAHHTYNNLLPKSPQFMPASLHAQQTYNTLLPRSDSIVMNRITRETNDLTGKLEGLNLDRQQGSWQEFGNLTSIASTTNVQNNGMQAHENENIVNAMTYQAPQPLLSKVKPALDGVQQYWKTIEISPTERPQPEAATSVSLTAPEEHGNEDQNALMHSTSQVPEMIPEEQNVIEKSCSLATNPQLSQSCSNPQAVVVAIGSMLIPIPMSDY